MRGLLGCGLHELRQPEIEDLHDAVPRDHHVLGLQIPVNDARGVGLGETVGDLEGQVQESPRGQRAGVQHFAQGLAVHELHRDVRGRVGRPDLMNRHDVGVVQRRSGARLLLEALATVGIGRELFRENLDRDFATQPPVARPIDLSHASGAQRDEDLVRSETRASRNCHRSRRILTSTNSGLAPRARSGGEAHGGEAAIVPTFATVSPFFIDGTAQT